MRGWVLLALARAACPTTALALCARGARHRRSIRTWSRRRRARCARIRESRAALAPFVMRALANIRYHDDPLSFDELWRLRRVATRHQPCARAVRDAGVARAARQRRAAAARGARAGSRLPTKRCGRASDRARATAIRDGDAAEASAGWRALLRCQRPRSSRSRGRAMLAAAPRIDRIALARGSRRATRHLQRALPRPALDRRVLLHALRQSAEMLAHRRQARAGAAAAGGTAGSPTGSTRRRSPTIRPSISRRRLRAYGQDRGVRMDARPSAVAGGRRNDAVRAHFGLGVNFIESLVNRHRIEATSSMRRAASRRPSSACAGTSRRSSIARPTCSTNQLVNQPVNPPQDDTRRLTPSRRSPTWRPPSRHHCVAQRGLLPEVSGLLGHVPEHVRRRGSGSDSAAVLAPAIARRRDVDQPRERVVPRLDHWPVHRSRARQRRRRNHPRVAVRDWMGGRIAVGCRPRPRRITPVRPREAATLVLRRAAPGPSHALRLVVSPHAAPHGILGRRLKRHGHSTALIAVKSRPPSSRMCLT